MNSESMMTFTASGRTTSRAVPTRIPAPKIAMIWFTRSVRQVIFEGASPENIHTTNMPIVIPLTLRVLTQAAGGYVCSIKYLWLLNFNYL